MVTSEQKYPRESSTQYENIVSPSKYMNVVWAVVAMISFIFIQMEII